VENAIQKSMGVYAAKGRREWMSEEKEMKKGD
jgi:hypothetical protein